MTVEGNEQSTGSLDRAQKKVDSKGRVQLSARISEAAWNRLMEIGERRYEYLSRPCVAAIIEELVMHPKVFDLLKIRPEVQQHVPAQPQTPEVPRVKKLDKLLAD